MNAGRKLLLALWVLLVQVATCQAQAPLRLWNIHPDGYPVTVALNSFAEDVKKITEGREVIEVFSNGALGDQPKAVPMVRSGEPEMAEFGLGPLSQEVKSVNAINLPFLLSNTEHVMTPEALVMSTKPWAKIAPSDQAKLREAGQRSALLMRQLWQKRMVESREIAIKSGVKFAAPTEFGAYTSRMKPLHQKYRTDSATRTELMTILASGFK